MSVLLPTGIYTVTRLARALDAHGTWTAGTVETTVTVPGRVRTNADGVMLALDPGAWPAVNVPVTQSDRYFVKVSGPDVGGNLQQWVVRSSSFRKGIDAQLDSLSYVECYAERDE